MPLCLKLFERMINMTNETTREIIKCLASQTAAETIAEAYGVTEEEIKAIETENNDQIEEEKEWLERIGWTK